MIKNKTLILQDQNGKSFETTIDEIVSNLSISDLEEGNSMDVYDSEKLLTDFPGLLIVDSEGNPFDPTTINDSENDKKIIALEVTVEATHSGGNANSVAYYSDSMEKDAETMMSPYQKPFIRNHDTYSEPIGRVINSSFGPSEFVERDTINATFKVTDEEAIPKFLDGRYKTVSIGAAPGRVSCDVCGKDILRDGVFKFCGHWKGEIYAGKKAVWSCRDLTYNEVSVVNNPADKWAQVKRITVIKADEKKEPEQKVGDSEMELENTVLNKDEANTLIDNILNDDDKSASGLETAPEATPVVEDGAEEKPVVEDTDPEDTSSKDNDEDKAPEKTIEDYVTMVQELTDRVESLEKEKTALTESIDGMTAEKTEINDKLVTAEAESKVARDQSLRLAMKYKSLLVDSVKTINSVVKDSLTDEEIENKSIKELSALADDMKTRIPATHATPTPVTNPGVVDNKESNVVTDIEETKTAKTSLVDVNVLMSDMIESATR